MSAGSKACAGREFLRYNSRVFVGSDSCSCSLVPGNVSPAPSRSRQGRALSNPAKHRDSGSARSVAGRWSLHVWG